MTKRLTMPLWPDAAETLGLSRNAVYLAAKRGDLPTIRIGKRLLVPIAKLEALLGMPHVPEAERQAELVEHRVQRLLLKRDQIELENIRRLRELSEIDDELNELAREEVRCPGSFQSGATRDE